MSEPPLRPLRTRHLRLTAARSVRTSPSPPAADPDIPPQSAGRTCGRGLNGQGCSKRPEVRTVPQPGDVQSGSLLRVRTRKPFLSVLGIVVAVLVAAVGLQTAASAAKEPPPPKPAKPPGKASALPFDQFPPSATDDVVLRWDEATLAAIRAVKPGPTVVARALAVVHTAMYDAWAPYDAVAVGTRLGGSLRRPAEERTAEFKSKAISYAAYRALRRPLPGPRGGLHRRSWPALGYDPADAVHRPTTPQGIGNVAAQAVLDARHRDGSNQLGDEPGGTAGKAYSDWTGYTPVNSWNQVVDPYRWQPLCVPTPPPGRDQLRRHRAVLRHPAVEPGDPVRADPARPVRPAGAGPVPAAGAGQGSDRPAGQDDRRGARPAPTTGRTVPARSCRPGHWAMFLQAAARADGRTLDQNVKVFFAFGNAMLDASIASWNAKRVQDTVRPITYIRWLYAGKKITSWGGPGKGIVKVDGSAWIPYQEAGVVSPPFAEYTSGHSAFSGAASQVFNRFAGTDVFKVELTVTVRAGRSTIEPGLVPTKDTVLKFKSFTDAADQAGLSRRYGGIHFEDADLAGRTLGRTIGNAAWTKAQTYFTGTAS